MKKIILFAIIMELLLVFSVRSHAALNIIGQGTSAHGTYNLIYDSDLDITWYDYTSAAKRWNGQVSWANELSVIFGSTVYDDWRLPITTQPDPSCRNQIDPGGGFPLQGYDYNCTGSEMGHLYYTELGNSAGGPLATGDFQNLLAASYWSGTEYAPDTDDVWYFETAYGGQSGDFKSNVYYGIVVRPGLAVDGTPVAPEPISSVLFVTGGTLLAGRRFIRRKA